jgi:hypothetical protein
VHHTSFLWALDPALLSLLTVPEKQPEYRLNRGHDEFLTTLQVKNDNLSVTFVVLVAYFI